MKLRHFNANDDYLKAGLINTWRSVVVHLVQIRPSFVSESYNFRLPARMRKRSFMEDPLVMPV